VKKILASQRSAVKTVILLALTLTSIFALGININVTRATGQQDGMPSSVDIGVFGSNMVGCNANGTSDNVIVVEHEISAVELEKLKQEIGICQEGINYNQVIDGHGTGLRPPTDEEWAAIAQGSSAVESVNLNSIQSPSSVDHSTESWFPPIGNQDGEGSCVAWAVGYYMKTYQEAKEHEWNLSMASWVGGYSGHPTPAYQDEIMSPDFIYHLINGGTDDGSSFSGAIQLVCFIGECSWEKMPYDPIDHVTWPSEEAWTEAPLYRGNSSGIEYIFADSDAGLDNLKNWIAAGNLAIIGVDANKYSSLTGEDFWTVDNYVNPSVNHANTIVGYDDTVAYVENGEVHQGAFKIANSWGVGGWENVPDGYYWISYEAMKQRVRYCMIYRDLIGYKPELTATFRIDHQKRDECNIVVGMGDVTSPITTKSFSAYTYQAAHNNPFCANNIVLDITEFEGSVPDVNRQSFFIRVHDGGSSTTGTLLYFAVNNTVSSDPPVTTVNGGYVYANLTLEKIIYIRVDGSIEPSTVPIQREGDVYTLTGNISGYYGILVERDNIILDGTNHLIDTSDCEFGYGLILEGRENVTIRNMTIVPFFTSSCIYAESSSNNFILDNKLLGDWRYGSGLKLSGSNNTISGNIGPSLFISGNNNTISGNNMTDTYENDGGIFLSYSNNSRIIGNNIEGSDVGGIELDSCSNNIVSGNNITGNGRYCGGGISILGSSSGNIISGNTLYDNGLIVRSSGNFVVDNLVNGKPLVYLENVSDYSVEDCGQVVLVNCNRIRVENLNLSHVNIGVELWQTNNTTISRNNITNNDEGVNTGIGEGTGIWLYASSNNNISGNNMANNGYGICLESSSNNNTIDENNISNNFCDIWLYNSSNNSIYHNNFVNNYYHDVQAGNANFWDDGYPSGGNYWSDYTDVDLYAGPSQDLLGSDGIWDHPYQLGENNQDNYPLVSLWAVRNASYLAVRGANNEIYYRIYNSTIGSWESWNVIPEGATCDSPAVVEYSGKLYFVVRGMDGASLWFGSVNITDYNFSGWALLSGASPSAPTLVTYGSKLVLVVRGFTNMIYYRFYDCDLGTWSEWTPVPDGATCDSPAAAVLGSSLHLVVRGLSTTYVSGNNTLWYGVVNLVDDSFSGWTMLDGWTPSAPRLAASETLDRLYLAVRGGDNRIWIKLWNGSAWEGWNALPDGATCDGPTITVVNGEFHIVVRCITGIALWHYCIDLATDAHSGWMLMDGWTTSAPTLTN
jgi:parallel beta-helix repeat protein